MNKIHKGHRSINYLVIRKNNKNTYLRVKKDHVLVTTNHFTSPEEIERIIYLHFEKFYKIIEATNKPKPFTLWGKEYLINIINTKTFSYDIGNDFITIYTNKKKEDAIKQLLKYESIRMYQSLESDLKKKIRQYKLSLVTIDFKYLKSKYGSCNITKKEIVLNTFLACLDPVFFEYVLYHEYAHLLVPNHQKEFYKVLDYFMTSHKEIQKRLKKIAIY